MLGCLAFHRLIIEPWRGGHIKALCCPDIASIVDADKVAGILTCQGNTSGAVGLIANDQIKIIQALLLCFMDRWQGLIGGKDDIEALSALARSKALRNLVTVRRYRDLEVIDRNVFRLL